MFCPSCGFEYALKTNFCKRCGETLSMTSSAGESKIARPKLALMFCAVAAFSIIGMFLVLFMYNQLAYKGLRGDELIIPFMMSMLFTGGIAGLLIWQLSRIITAYKEAGRKVVVENRYITGTPPAQLGVPAEIPQQVEPPSVVEHTTRQIAGKYRG